MKHYCLVMCAVIGGMGCATTVASEQNPEPMTTALPEVSEPPAPSTERSDGSEIKQIDVSSPALGAADQQVVKEHAYLKTLCERGDHEAVRVHRSAFKPKLKEPSLVRCWAEALLSAGQSTQATEVLKPLLSRTDIDGQLSRQLLSHYYERLGRWELVEALYQNLVLSDDPAGLRSLGVAFYQLGKLSRLSALLPERRPIQDDAWRWLWWLREFEEQRLPSLNELSVLQKELSVEPKAPEVTALLPLVTQAHRRGEWFRAAKDCSEKAELEDNEVLALTMSRTSISAALRGDLPLWEASLSCALTLAQATTSPEETCQEIHREQMDWEIHEKLSPEVRRYPNMGDCGLKNAKVRQWLERWSSDKDAGASS